MDEFSERPIHDRGNPAAPSACSRRDELNDNLLLTRVSKRPDRRRFSDRVKHKVGPAKRRCAMKAITTNSFQWPVPLEIYDRTNKVTKEETFFAGHARHYIPLSNSAP